MIFCTYIRNIYSIKLAKVKTIRASISEIHLDEWNSLRVHVLPMHAVCLILRCTSSKRVGSFGIFCSFCFINGHTPFSLSLLFVVPLCLPLHSQLPFFLVSLFVVPFSMPFCSLPLFLWFSIQGFSPCLCTFPPCLLSN